MTLQDFFQENPRVALGFSGGVDSAYLLYAAKQWGAQVRPYFIKTPFQPQFELEDAQKLAAWLSIPLTVIHLDVLSEPSVAENPENRCYYCKRRLFGVLQKQAMADGYEVLIDGTNASDEVSDRPGMRALQEMRVRSPLRECGLTKPQIRSLSKEAKLFTWNKPAYACLATRIPTGTRLTTALLQRVESGEQTLNTMGFRDFRLRTLGDAAKLQVKPEQFSLVFEKREEIRTALSPWFRSVLLDLKPR